MADKVSNASCVVPFKHDEFILADVYPDVRSHLMHRQPSIKDALEAGFVTLDANALLFPYEINSHFYGEFVDKLKNLAETDRLLVPAHAMREFFKHRQEKIGEISQKINGMIQKASTNVFSQRMSLLEDDEIMLEAKEKNKEFAKAGQELAALLKKVRVRIDDAGYGNDPLSKAYQSTIAECIEDICLDAESRLKIIEEAKVRFSADMPPGYKDKSKKSGLGDFIIWKTILKFADKNPGKNCIFVTDDIKTDWYFRHDGPKGPRAELIDEYRAISKGGFLYFCQFSEFLNLMEASQNLINAAMSAKITPMIEEIDLEVKILENQIKEEQLRVEQHKSYIMSLKGAHNRYHAYGRNPEADAKVDADLRAIRDQIPLEERKNEELQQEVMNNISPLINRIGQIWRRKLELKFKLESLNDTAKI